MSHHPANRLQFEKSPYLLQHAHNPVDWYPWGDEAFERARREDLPIFLSIGYSTCHWCHVMERESFVDDQIARVMNERYVCIKVDREERPDVDRVYMAAVQTLTGAGGWPLSAWLTPTLEPYYAGTYFPPDSRWGRPGFRDVLLQLSDAWKNQRTQVEESAGRIVETLSANARGQAPASGSLDRESVARRLRLAVAHLGRVFDPELGGFGSAPKFPRPAVFTMLLRYAVATGDAEARDMVLLTLRQLWAGGINDHLGGGFHRYSVDRQWRVPHFEKMLYDQAQLAVAFLEAARIETDELFSRAARAVLDYVERDLMSPGGGFYSAEDADSASDPEHPDDKREGAFYLWTPRELASLLGEADAELVSAHYGILETGNTLSDPHGDFGDGNVLYEARAIEDLAHERQLSVPEVRTRVAEARRRLFEARLGRPRPHLDDKVLTSWNGMMIAAFARAAVELDEPRYVTVAARAARFVLENNGWRTSDGGTRLRRRFRDGESGFEGQLDDYANLGLGLLALFEATWDSDWLRSAVEVATAIEELFADGAGGALWDSPPGDASVLMRTQESYDGAEPSANALACQLFLKLSRLLDRPAWERLAASIVGRFSQVLDDQPSAAPLLLALADALADPPEHVVICAPQLEDAQPMLRAVRAAPWKPHLTLVVLTDAERWVREQSSFLAALGSTDGQATAYHCRDLVCELPTADPRAVTESLARSPTPFAEG